MKKITLLAAIGISSCLFFSSCKKKHEPTPTQPQWIKKANLSAPGRNGAVGFAIGDKAYISAGYDGADRLGDTWEYNPSTNVWTQKADFGGSPRNNATAFVINSKAYVGTGFDGAYRTDFWEYNPTSNSWNQKTDFGGEARGYAVGFSINGKGYVGTGALITSPASGSGTVYKDVWEYNPVSDSWTKKTDFPGTPRFGAINFVIGSKAYVGTGLDVRNNAAGQLKDFWEYNPGTDAWSKKADIGGGARTYAAAFAIDNKGYVATGAASDAITKDFWAYDPAHDSWKQSIDFGGDGRYYAVGFTVNSKGYVTTGYAGNNIRPTDLWEFNP